MSSFECKKCGVACVDTEFGYVTGCDHHRWSELAQERHFVAELMRIQSAVERIGLIASTNRHFLAKPMDRLVNELETPIQLLKSNIRRIIKP